MAVPTPPPREADALSALQRLYERKLVSLEQAQVAARLITGDPATVFPPPREPPAAASNEGQPIADSATQAP